MTKKKTDKTTPQQRLLSRLTAEMNNLGNSWRQVKAKIAESEEALENLRGTKSQIEGQHSAVKRNLQSLVAEFKDLELPQGMGKTVRAKPKPKKKPKKEVKKKKK